MATKPRKRHFKRLKAGLEEGIAHAKGDLTLKTVEIPETPPEIAANTLSLGKGKRRIASESSVNKAKKRDPFDACADGTDFIHFSSIDVPGVPMAWRSGFATAKQSGRDHTANGTVSALRFVPAWN